MQVVRFRGSEHSRNKAGAPPRLAGLVVLDLEMVGQSVPDPVVKNLSSIRREEVH